MSEKGTSVCNACCPAHRPGHNPWFGPGCFAAPGVLPLGDDLAAASHLLESLHLHHEVRFSWSTVFSLICCTALLTAQGRIVPALHLVGAAVAARQASGAVVLPFEQTVIDEARAVAQQQLGEEATQAAWRQGEAMTLEEAVALALATISDN